MNVVEKSKEPYKDINILDSNKIYTKYIYLVRAVIYRHKIPKDEVDDLISESFTRAFENLRSLINPNSIKSWICSITQNVCKDYIRKKQKEEKALNELYNMNLIDLTENTYRSIEEIIEDNYPSLPKLIVYLHYKKKMRLDEISSYLNIDSKEVKNAVKHGKKGVLNNE